MRVGAHLIATSVWMIAAAAEAQPSPDATARQFYSAASAGNPQAAAALTAKGRMDESLRDFVAFFSKLGGRQGPVRVHSLGSQRAVACVDVKGTAQRAYAMTYSAVVLSLWKGRWRVEEFRAASTPDPRCRI